MRDMASVTTFGNKGCHDAIRQAIASKDFAAARELALAARQQGDTSGLVLATLGELAMHMDGDFEQGAAYLREACQQPKRTTTMLMNLGICLMELCRIDEAIEPLMAAYRMQPDTDGLVGRLMTALEWCGRWGEMTTILQKFVDEKPDPSAIDWLELAQTYDRANQASEARGAFYRSVEIEETEQNCDLLANFLQQRGEIAEAFKWSEKACALSDSCQTQINHAYILMGAGRTEEALDEMRQVVARDTPGAGRARHSSVLFFEHYGQSFTREDCYRSAVAWAEKHIDASSIRTDHQRDLSANRRLRIGYVSADFRTHSVTYFMESVLDGCNPKAVENIAYSVGESQDATTERLSRKFHEFRYMGSHDVSRFAQQVEDDQIDILVDLGGHTTNNRQAVFGVKPAPIQVTWCGHPDTVGNPAIDYRIVDALTDPPDTETWHTEELAYMPDSFLCYRPPVHAPAIGPPPRTTNGHVTFGSFNNLMKVTPLVRGLWAQVLAAVPDSRLILKIRGGEEAIVHERLLDDFARVGVDRERVIIRGMVGNATDHLACYNEVDIALDSYPYNGTTTTCEALWMGVPVLTLCGDVHCSRVGYSLLSNCDMEFFVAHDPEEYVRKAIALAGNTEASETIRKTMRQRLAASPLCNAPRFAHHLELLYRSMWHRWCEGQGVEIPEQAPAELTTSHEDRLAASARRRLGNKGTRPTIRVLHNMARTGGTLLGKCLGSMQDIALLSEIHPQGVSQFNPLDQACAWHGLLRDEDVRAFHEDGKTMSFVDAVGLIAQRAEEQGKTLVIRDWAHLDYIAVPFMPVPSNRLGLVDALADGFDIRNVCLVRHPLDTFLSLRKLAVMSRNIAPDVFLRGTRLFAEQAADIGFVRYEDFTASPDQTLQRFCEQLDVPFDAGYRCRWWTYRKITGDTSNSRGAIRNTIQPMPRAVFEPDLLETFRACEDYWRVLQLLDYEDAEMPVAAEAAGANPT